MGKYAATVEDHLILPARVSLTDGQERLFQLQGRPIPNAIDVRMVIDTGSKRSTLLPGLLTYLDATRAQTARVDTSLASGETSLHWVRVEFPGTSLASLSRVLIARLDLPPPLRSFHGLIGRDLLKRWESFRYEGRRGRYTLRDSAGLFGWLRL